MRQLIVVGRRDSTATVAIIEKACGVAIEGVPVE